VIMFMCPDCGFVNVRDYLRDKDGAVMRVSCGGCGIGLVYDNLALACSCVRECEFVG